MYRYKYVYEDGRTLYELFQRGLKLSGDNPCMGYRPIDAAGNAGDFVWMTCKCECMTCFVVHTPHTPCR